MLVRQHAQDIMKFLRDTHLPFFLETERFVVEITRSFKPSFEQQLQHIISSLMDSLAKEDPTKTVTAEAAKKMEEIQEFLTSLDQQLEQEKAKTTGAAAATAASSASKESAQLTDFLQTYKPLITKDLIKAKGAAPAAWGTFKDLYLVLRKWQVAIRRQLSRASGPRQLENLSKTLAESKGSQMEVPGQYLDMKEPMPTQHVKVDRVLPDVEIADLNMACHRKLVIRGNDSKLYHFVVEATNSPYPSIGSSDERILQLSQLMNRCMEKEKQTRRRQMNLHIRSITGLAPRCRLISVDRDAVSLTQVLEDFLAPKGMTADGVALKFAESVQKLAKSEKDPQMAAMNEVSDLLPDTVLLDYIRAQIPSNDKLWTFRKHLAVQYACQVLVSHALFVAPPTPSKLVLSKLQGDVVLVGASPGLNKDQTRMSDDHAESDAVPFRMTRMMTILLSSVGLQGGFSAAMGAAAMALTNPNRMLKHHLYSLLREEILSYGYPQPKTGQALIAARNEHGKLVNQRSIQCADQVEKRLLALSPEYANANQADNMVTMPLNSKVLELMQAALDPVKQIAMPCLWHPWA